MNSVTFKDRHNYFNKIYANLHPYNNKETRVYQKEKENFGITFTGEKIIHSSNRDLVFSKKSFENFKSIKLEQCEIDKKSPQDKITFYLTNNLVPVNLKFFIFLFNRE